MGYEFGWEDLGGPMVWGTKAAIEYGVPAVEGIYNDVTGNKPATAPTPALTPGAYHFGGSPEAAQAAAQRGYNLGDAAYGTGQNMYSEGIGRSRAVGGRPIQQGEWAMQDRYLQQASQLGTDLSRLEAREGPSAAEAQLQAGTNQAMAGQLALARSGRGFGGNAAAMGLAQSNMAGIQANQATSAAALRAQENAAWRQRQAGNIATGAGIAQGVAGQYGQQAATDLNAYYTGQGQNDAAALGYMGMANDAYFRGADTRLRGDALAAGVQGQQMSGQQAYDDARIRMWAAQNGLTLGEQQRQDQQNMALMQGAATLGAAAIAASDVRGKQDIVRTDSPAVDFARAGSMVTPQPPDTAALDAVAAAPGYGYRYQDPGAPGAAPGEQYGPMAQDLAKTPAGATTVKRGPDGKLAIDTSRLSLVNTSAISAQQRELDEIKRQLAAFSGAPSPAYPRPSRGSF